MDFNKVAEISLMCPFCNLPLGEFEIEHGHKWHKACAKCHYCQHEVTHEMASKLIESVPNGDSTTISHLLYHQPCHERALMEQFKVKEFPIVQAQIDILNKFMLSTREPLELDIEVIRTLLRTLLECTANVSIALNRKIDKIKVRDTESWRETIAIREENNKIDKRILEEKKTRLASERADPKLRDRRKAIAGLMSAFGISQADAEVMVDKKEIN